MIDFSRSTFTWKSQPWQPDPYYRYTGGFVGTPGQVSTTPPASHAEAVQRVAQRWRAEGKALPPGWEQYMSLVQQPQI